MIYSFQNLLFNKVFSITNPYLIKGYTKSIGSDQELIFLLLNY